MCLLTPQPGRSGQDSKRTFSNSWLGGRSRPNFTEKWIYSFVWDLIVPLEWVFHLPEFFPPCLSPSFPADRPFPAIVRSCPPHLYYRLIWQKCTLWNTWVPLGTTFLDTAYTRIQTHTAIPRQTADEANVSLETLDYICQSVLINSRVYNKAHQRL